LNVALYVNYVRGRHLYLQRINYAREESHHFSGSDVVKPERKGPKKPRAIVEREIALQEQFRSLQQQMNAFQQGGVFANPAIGIKQEAVLSSGVDGGDTEEGE